MANELGKTLSKKGLYAPLSVYRGDQEDFSGSKKRKIAPSLKDSALVDFLYTVGRDHNRKAKIVVGKNNGCKPVSQNDVSNRIRQRALTLIGGGINTSVSGEKNKKSTSKATHLYPTMSNRKRKLIRQQQESAGRSKLCPYSNTGDKLSDLNKKWNAYVHRFLRDQSCDLQAKKTRALTTMLTRHLQEVGVVGSFVKITACKSDQHITSKRGFVVGETAQTWRVALLPRGANQGTLGKGLLFKLRTVPKQGTRVTLILPFDITDHSTDSASIYITLE